MIEFSHQTTGMHVSYIELTKGKVLLCHDSCMSNTTQCSILSHYIVLYCIVSPHIFLHCTAVAVTIVVNNGAKVFCALFHDRDDGRAFGRLICSEILYAFTQEFSSDLSKDFHGRNLKDFHGFNYKIADVIRNSVKPVLKLRKYYQSRTPTPAFLQGIAQHIHFPHVVYTHTTYIHSTLSAISKRSAEGSAGHGRRHGGGVFPAR